MSLIDDFLFEPIEAWEQLPADIVLGDVAGIAVDSKDRIYLFNRGAHPVVVLNRDGTFLHAWGQGVFTNPHGASIGPDDSLYLTDNGDHTVRKFTPDGKLLLQIGVPGQPSPPMSNLPFCRCTHTALSPTGDIYVSDGYGNACVHKFSPDGKLLHTWGRPGTREGEFNLPHNICCDEAGLVYVADRENARVPVFDGDGTYLRSAKEKLFAEVYKFPYVGGTGAGDAFDAGYITGLLQGLGSRDCMAWGSALGGSCVRSISATESVFTRDEAEAYINEHPLKISTW
ncbi:MAG: hypothetical protein J0M17_07140 [Planctomycetes bacterium]|nr:hypothetical protein [Planctomycetota bacterium]